MAEALQSIAIKTITGDGASLGDYAGKVLLVVNVASACGLTPQYEGLVALYRKYRDQGFEVLGFPANDFGAQEPGTDEEIASFCTTKFDVDFPMFSKIVATGPDKHPLYATLTAAQPTASGDGDSMREMLRSRGRTPTEAPEVLWNFEKFLIARDGSVVGRFVPRTEPNAPELEAAIKAELAK
jgi:glutathione peroxidase